MRCGGLTPLSAVLPCPGHTGWVGEGKIQVALCCDVLVTRASGLHEVVHNADEWLPGAPAVNGELCALGLGPTVLAGDLGAHRIGLDVVAEITQAPWGTIQTV